MKVLHLISGGDTGGAKTHIMTLLSELKNRMDVRLGVFIEDVFLEEARELGIETKVFPQKSRFDLSVVDKIKQYVEEEKIDLIHCHGARANFIGVFVMKKVDVPFVTTVHSDYRLDFKGIFYKQLIFKNLNLYSLRKFQNFIAVSDNFKTMLEERGFGKKHIDVVYNGIRLNRSEEMVDKVAFCKRYGLDPSTFKFGILARLEEVKDHGTFLRGAAAFLKKHRADFLIGGSGTELESLKKLTDELGIGEYVHFLGEIKDPFSFLQGIDVNCLTSLSESFPYVILEGGKLKKPTIATNVGGISKVIEPDRTGYLFTPKDAKALGEHMIRLYEYEPLRQELGENLYQRIAESFSDDAMVQQHMAIYERLLRERRVLLSGFYGFDNQGDDAILEAIVGELRKTNPHVYLQVLSNNPEKTKATYAVDSVYRFNPFTIAKVMRRTEMLISGGGSLLQDVTSSRSLWYYLFVIALSKFYKKKTVIYANGVGPINGSFNRKLTKKVLNNVHYISLRDQDSADYLKELGLDEKNLIVRSDPVFLLEPDEKSAETILDGAGLSEGFTVLNLRPWRGEERFFPEIKRAVESYLQQGHHVLLLPMHLSKDRNILELLERDIAHQNLHSYYGEMSVSTLMGIMKKAEIVIAMRLHGLIYSAAVGTKAMALSYDPKVEGFMKEIDSPYLLSVDHMKAEDILDMIQKIKDDATYVDSLLEGDERRKSLARANAREVMNLLEGTYEN
ncbi:MAG: polysaccharide pyruvyl transferase CsaB [Tissierellia bacterium]|nr:polysaccharide pyruvyl transferase CsaB [Tissierellia bacterium]